MDLFPGEGKKVFHLRKCHKDVEFDSKKVSHSVSEQPFKFFLKFA